MAQVEQIIEKRQLTQISLKPSELKELKVRNGFDCNYDTVNIQYDKKFVNLKLTVKYIDANGNETSYRKILEPVGIMHWKSLQKSNSNYGSIEFSCEKELEFCVRIT